MAESKGILGRILDVLNKPLPGTKDASDANSEPVERGASSPGAAQAGTRQDRDRDAEMPGTSNEEAIEAERDRAEAEHEALKARQEQEREALKHQREQEREAAKHQREMEKEADKRQRELDKEARKQEREREREERKKK